MKLAQLAQVTPYPSSSQLHEALSRHPAQEQGPISVTGSAAITANAKHRLALTKKAQEAWIEAMCSKIARADLLQMALPENPTFEAATAEVLAKLRTHPEENKDLIRLYERLLADIQKLEVSLPINKTPESEMPPPEKTHGHEHEHGNTWWGDPDEPVHGLIPFQHIFVPLFAGASNLPAHYREKAIEMIKNLSSYLAKAGISEHLGEKIFTLAIYAAVLPLSVSATIEGVGDFRRGWSTLVAKLKERDEERTILATLHACSPALKETEMVRNKQKLLEHRIEALSEEIRQAKSTLLLGLSAGSTGVALSTLSLMKFIAEGFHEHGNAAGMETLGKVIPAAQTAAAAGAGVLGYALQKKSGTIRSFIRQGANALTGTFSRYLPQSILRRDANDIEEGMPETHKKYHDAMTAKSEKYARFIGRFHGINSIFFASSIANAASNLVEDGLYIFSRWGNPSLHEKTIDAVAKIMEGNDISGAVIGVGMAGSSLQFFHGHPGLMKLESARFSKDREIDAPFLLLNDIIDPARGFELRVQLYKQLSDSHIETQLFLREIELETHSRSVAASLPKLLQDKIRKSDIADFLIKIIDIKSGYLPHKQAAAGNIFQKMADHHLVAAANEHDRKVMNEMLAKSYQDFSKESILLQQLLLIKETLETWKNDDAEIDVEELAPRLKSALSVAIHGSGQAEDTEHHHHFPLHWGHQHGHDDTHSIYDVVAEYLNKDKDRYDKQMRRLTLNHMYAATLASASVTERVIEEVHEEDDPASSAQTHQTENAALAAQGAPR